MAYQQKKNSVWEDIVALFAALYNAIRNGFASLAESIRRMLAQMGYYQNAYYA